MTWPHLVVERLKARWPRIHFDYVNGGVPGYVVNSSLQNLLIRIKPLQPDIVVIYHATNDLSRNSYQLALKAGIVKPRAEMQKSWLSDHSLLWYLIEKNLRIKSHQEKASDQTKKLQFKLEDLAIPFQADLISLVEESKNVAPIVALATFSHRLRRNQTSEEQIQAAVTSLYYMPYMTIPGLLDAFEAYNNIIRDVAQATDTLLIDQEMDIPGDGEHFSDSVHFTDRGSVAMADRVAKALVRSKTVSTLIADKTTR